MQNRQGDNHSRCDVRCVLSEGLSCSCWRHDTKVFLFLGVGCYVVSNVELVAPMYVGGRETSGRNACSHSVLLLPAPCTMNIKHKK